MQTYLWMGPFNSSCEYELDELKEIKNDIDAITLAKIALQRNFHDAVVYVFHGCDHGNGVVLIKARNSPKDSGDIITSKGTNDNFVELHVV